MVQTLKTCVREAKIKLAGNSTVVLWKFYAKALYDSDSTQKSIATLIIFAFFLSIADAEIHSLEGEAMDKAKKTIEVMELIIVSLFTIELMINLFANWFKPFFLQWSNLFDIFIVTVCWLAEFGNGKVRHPCRDPCDSCCDGK